MAAHDHVTDAEQTSSSTDRFAVYDPEADRICHTETGAAIRATRDAAAEMVAAVADHMGISADRLTVVRVRITPLDATTAAVDGDTGDTEYTTGSIMVNRGPHRQHSQIVEYREAEDGAWAVKTPEDDEFWIFKRAGTERDLQQAIRAKWDATYSNPDAFTDRSCPTGDL
jgi:hypothetical protein